MESIHMWWRTILGVIAGVIAGGVVAFGLESLGHIIFPPPSGIDLTNPEQVKTIMDTLPLGSKLFVIAAWIAASFIGGLVAAWIGRSYAAAIGVAIVLTGFGVWTMTMIPHPLWMIVSGVAGLILPALLGGRIAMTRNGGQRQ
jgi:hypothetical protein